MVTWPLDKALQLVRTHQEVQILGGDCSDGSLTVYLTSLASITSLSWLSSCLPSCLATVSSCSQLRRRPSCQQLRAGMLGVGQLLLHLLLELFDLLLQLLLLL